jgi:hypothetical protein
MKIVWRCPLRASWFVDQGKSASISMNKFMPAKTNTRYRWVIVAAGGLLGCVAIGTLFSLPVFLQPIARDTGWSISGVSTSMTIAFLAMALGSVSWA